MLKLELKPRNGKRTFEAVGCQKTEGRGVTSPVGRRVYSRPAFLKERTGRGANKVILYWGRMWRPYTAWHQILNVSHATRRRLAGVTLIFSILVSHRLLRNIPHSAHSSTCPLIAGSNRGHSAAHALVRLGMIDMRQTPVS